MQQLIGAAPVQVNFALNISESRTKEFLQNTTAFVKRNHHQLEHTPYILVLSDPVAKGEPLTVQQVLYSCGLGKCIFFVDEKLRISRTEDGEGKISACSKLTSERNLFAVLVTDTYIYKLLRGNTIDEGDVAGAPKNPLVGSKWHHPMSDFDSLLKDHLENYIKQEQGVSYWSDKQKRILLSGENGTEEIFHRALFWWLKHYVSNRLKVYGQPKGLGQYASDIIVVTIEGCYLIEIKWLGKNKSGTTCGQDHIDSGLAQVMIYLKGDEDCVSGHLVIYDGRCFEDHQTKSAHNDSLRHVRCTKPKILFLESETPSKQAVQIAKKNAQ